MSETTQNFKASIGQINDQIGSKIQPAAQDLSSAVGKAVSIITAIEDYNLDIHRAAAGAAVGRINARLATFKALVNSVEEIDFDSIWPEEKGDTILLIIAAEKAAAAAAAEEEPAE